MKRDLGQSDLAFYQHGLFLRAKPRVDIVLFASFWSDGPSGRTFRAVLERGAAAFRKLGPCDLRQRFELGPRLLGAWFRGAGGLRRSRTRTAGGVGRGPRWGLARKAPDCTNSRRVGPKGRRMYDSNSARNFLRPYDLVFLRRQLNLMCKKARNARWSRTIRVFLERVGLCSCNIGIFERARFWPCLWRSIPALLKRCACAVEMRPRKSVSICGRAIFEKVFESVQGLRLLARFGCEG